MTKHRHIQNLLVTGGLGFIGGAFIRFALKSYFFTGKIVNIDALTYAAREESLGGFAEDPRYVFYKGDICDSALLAKIFDEHSIDTVIHFAAETHVDRSIIDPLPFIRSNVIGTYTLLEEVRKRPWIHFHHVSTDEVYGDLKEGFFHELSPYRPNSPYAASKAASDHFVRAYANTYDLSMTISHCSNNYGPYQFPEKFIPLIIKNLREKNPIPIYGEGQNIRDWLYVEDHVEALFAILRRGRRGEIYDIGGGEELKNIDLVEKLIVAYAKKTGSDLEPLRTLISFVKDRPGHDLRYAIDASKIKNELFWHPRHSFEEGITKAIEWYLENPAFFNIQKECQSFEG